MATAARVRTVYLILGLNLAMLAVLIGTIVYVATLRDKVEATNAQSLAACSRGNLIRSQLNYQGSVLQSFLAQAASTRELTAQHADDDHDPVTAQINRDAATAYRSLANGLSPLKVVDCEVIYP